MYKTICVTDRHLVNGSFLRQIEGVLLRRPWALILREKDLDEQAYRNLAERILPLCREAGVLCLFNSRPELARTLCADGLQAPFPLAEQMSAAERQSFPLFAVSVHSESQARTAEKLGADMLIYGHVFATQCKPDLAPRGISRLREVCAAVSVPVFAIGGIDESNRAECVAAGAEGVCMMSGFMRSPVFR